MGTEEPNSALLLEVFNEHEYLKSTRIEKCWSKEHKPNKHPGANSHASSFDGKI